MAGTQRRRWLGLVVILACTLGALAPARAQESAAESTPAESIPAVDDSRPLTERLWGGAHDVWTFQVSSSEGHRLTVGNILTALFLLILAFFVSRLVSRGASRRIARRVGLEAGTVASIQTLSFYILFVILGIFALNLANIPITMFAVLAGALALGVGLGSQNVIKNFISGLILLMERPVRVGDLIEVAGTAGIVEHISFRSTRIRPLQNLQMIVPNSSLLENNVVNWTLSDRKVRVCVPVGVAYGSPTREVERVIREVLAEHPRVKKEPAPIVLFSGFGDSALLFEAHFWTEVRNMMDRLRLESEVRFRIDDLFREGEIVIAFPQRDVHVDSAAPLEVRVVAEEEGEAS